MQRKLKMYDEFINERNLSVSIDGEVVGAVDHRDDHAIDSIKRIAASSTGKEEIKTFLFSIGIPIDRQEEIIGLLAGGDWAKASSYLLNRNLNISSLLNQKKSAFEINKTLFGITNKKLSDKLFSYQWSTQPVMGKGEVWLALVLQNGSKAGIGDVEVSGSNMEVKGVGARLVGQKGYGDAKRMGSHFRNAMIHVCSLLKINYTPPQGSGIEWSVTKTQSRLLGKSLKDMAEIRGGFSNSDIKLISGAIIEAYKNLYTGLRTQNYKDSLVSSINSKGDIDLRKFNLELVKIGFEYYHQVEQFTYFAMSNHHTSNFLIITPDKFSDLLMKDIIKYSPASWGASGGAYGGYVAIAIDSLSTPKRK